MDKLVYVMGTSHSGSTLLSFLLNTHPEIGTVGEAAPSLKRNHDRHLLPCSCGRPIGECSFWKEVFDRVAKKGIKFTPGNWAMHYVTNPTMRNLFYQHHANPAFEFLRKNVTPFLTWSIRKKNRANIQCIRTILEIQKKTVFADTSKSVYRFELLRKIPQLDVFLVWLVRDIRAYVNSMKRRKVDPEKAAVIWKKSNNVMYKIFEKMNLEKKKLVKYEHLCANPQNTVSSIFQLLNIRNSEIPNDFKSSTHHIIGHKTRLNGVGQVMVNEKWRNVLTSEEQRVALSIGGGLVHNLGYR